MQSAPKNIDLARVAWTLEARLKDHRDLSGPRHIAADFERLQRKAAALSPEDYRSLVASIEALIDHALHPSERRGGPNARQKREAARSLFERSQQAAGAGLNDTVAKV